MIKTKQALFAGFVTTAFSSVVGIAVAIAGANHEVIESDKKFSTSELEISVGDTVTFVNDDTIKQQHLDQENEVQQRFAAAR